MSNELDMPQGFERALAKNFCAMKYFANLSDYDQLMVIEKAKSLKSKEQMQAYVKKLGDIM